MNLRMISLWTVEKGEGGRWQSWGYVSYLKAALRGDPVKAEWLIKPSAFTTLRANGYIYDAD